jgi:hypothetical protein
LRARHVTARGKRDILDPIYIKIKCLEDVGLQCRDSRFVFRDAMRDVVHLGISERRVALFAVRLVNRGIDRRFTHATVPHRTSEAREGCVAFTVRNRSLDRFRFAVGLRFIQSRQSLEQRFGSLGNWVDRVAFDGVEAITRHGRGTSV